MNDKPRPCFYCNHKPRMDRHTVCADCHNVNACHVCNPKGYYVFPTLGLLAKPAPRTRKAQF